jgi:hypothetical protein
LQTIEELKPLVRQRVPADNETAFGGFIVAYAAAALLVRAGRFMIDCFAADRIVQRKLNEAEPRFGLPRKQFAAVHKSLTSPFNAWRIHDAVRFADAHRREIDAMEADPVLSDVIAHLRQAEHALRLSKRRYVLARARYRWHALRRRGASALGQSMFGLFEMSGRIIADMRNPFHAKRVTPEIQRQLSEILQPGDVLISRHDDAMSNLFLPGYWIHASLHIGPASTRRDLPIEIDAGRAQRWIDPIRVLEARKDGVLFRSLDDTLSVDAVAVIRPRLDRPQLAQGLSRALSHEGKLYDFEFDFFRSDRLVCTEVAYRGFHGIGGLEFTLSHRAGRPTLSSEDLINMALSGRGYEPMAVFGAPACPDRIVHGEQARRALEQSCRSEAR